MAYHLSDIHHKPFDDGQIEDKMTHAETVLHNLSIVFFCSSVSNHRSSGGGPNFQKPSKIYKKHHSLDIITMT